MPDPVKAFLVAFVVEAFAAGYTLAVTRGRWQVAILCSFLVAWISAHLTAVWIDNRSLMDPTIMGETFGSLPAILLSMRKK